MLWLIITILFYFILAVVSLIDKYLLKDFIPNPKIYTFYIGIFWILVLFLIPFVDFSIPHISQIILSLISGMTFILALYWMNNALYLFEVSRVIPTIGALIPLFTFGLIFIFSLGKEKINFLETISFILLISGSVLITLEKKTFIKKSFLMSLFAAFLFSISFVTAKYVYLNQSFWNGFIWIRMGGFFTALLFLILTPEIKEEIFKKRVVLQNKTIIIFLPNQIAGAIASILQNWAIALAPLIFVPFINALQGIQYFFLFILTLLLSFKFPKILKEEVSKEIIFQKIIAILLISGGLILLTI